MSNLYLKNMDKALEFLDLAEEKGIEKECVCSVSDRTIAISNLKMLRPMVKAYGYGANEQYREVVSSLMKNRKTVEVINKLAGDADRLDSKEIIILGMFLQSKMDFEPETLTTCLRDYKNLFVYSYDYKVGHLHILYKLLETHHVKLEKMILGSRFSEKILSTITEKCQNNDNIEEKYLEKYYILEKLPDDFDISKEIDRIDTFLNILEKPGAIELYGLAKGCCSSVKLLEREDYTSVIGIIQETVAFFEDGLEHWKKENPSEEEGHWSDDELWKKDYFTKASFTGFDEKLLKGYLKNISGFSKDQIMDSVVTKASFLAVCTGNRYTDLVNRIVSDPRSSDRTTEIVLDAITKHKKAFLRLMENNLDLFLELPITSILYNKTFWEICNVNSLQINDIRTLLKRGKDGKFIYIEKAGNFLFTEGRDFTFQEISTLYTMPQWIHWVYVRLDESLRRDEKLKRIRQLFHKEIYDHHLTMNDCIVAAAAISKRSLEDYCKQFKFKISAKEEVFRLMVREEADNRLTPIIAEVEEEMDIITILRNLQQPELFDMGLKKFKENFTHIDTNSKWLREEIEIPEEYEENFRRFCLSGNAAITYDYYHSNEYNKEQAKNVLLLAKAAIYNMLDGVKYQNFQEEITSPVSEKLENIWSKNLSIEKGKIKTAEYTDFQSCMLIGAKPAYTCINHQKGSHNECLLSIFDGNKKVVYVKEHGTIIGRAIMRLTKESNSVKPWGNAELHFADVASENRQSSDERLILFLERCYCNGFSGKKQEMIYQSLFELAQKKAEELEAELVLAPDYELIAANNGFIRKQSNVYVSKSKNGNQYLDSLGGGYDTGGYYVSGVFYFAS